MNKGKIVFSQLMEFLPHYEFQKCVAKYKGEYKVKNFSCMDQFLTMSFAQLTYRESLRDTIACLNAAEHKLYHMGIRTKPTRNNLAHANGNRNWRIYQDFALILIRKATQLYEGTPIDSEYNLQETVYALDSTTIDLCLSLFPWAKFRKTKGAIKLHTLLELRSAMPQIIYMTHGKVHDVRILDHLPLETGAIYIMDKGYVDFGRLYRFCNEMATYVTRAKKNFDYRRIKSFPKNKESGISADQIVKLNGLVVSKKYPVPLRRISFRESETGKHFVFLTNNFHLPAETIAFLYSCRWRIEIFFRWIKQNLRIKSFFGTTPNAVKTQIWIAVATYALIVIVKKQLKLTESLYTIFQILSIVIFEKEPVNHIVMSNKNKIIDSESCKQLMLFD